MFACTYIYAMAIVGNLEQLKSSILDQDLEGCGTSVHSILNQFFQSMHGSDNDLPCGNLIHNIRVKCLVPAISLVCLESLFDA